MNEGFEPIHMFPGEKGFQGTMINDLEADTPRPFQNANDFKPALKRAIASKRAKPPQSQR
jgi:hypothetical protein